MMTLQPWALLLLCTGCASTVWNARVFDCEEIEAIEVEGSVVSVLEEGEDDEDCYVQVAQLSGVEVEGRTLVGEGAEVFTNRLLLIDVANSVLNVDADGLVIDGGRGDYRWLPDDRQLDVTDVDGAVDLSGSVATLVLEDAGRVTFTAAEGLDRLEGEATSLTFSSRHSFDSIAVEVDDFADLTVPRQALYQLRLDAEGAINVDVAVRTTQLEPTSTITVAADGAIDVRAGPGGSYTFPSLLRSLGIFCYPREQEMLVTVGTDRTADFVQFDAVNSVTYPSSRVYETMRLERDPNASVVDGTTGFSRRQSLNQTQFACQNGEDFDEAIGDGQEMSYLIRVYDNDRMVDCYATGNDPMGMLTGAYLQGDLRTFDRPSITPNACGISDWEPR